MKMPSWLKKMKNDHEASSSRDMRRSHLPPSPPPPPARPPPALLRQLPHAPRPHDDMAQPACIKARPPWQRNRHYVPLVECEELWAANQSVDYPDVSFPHGCNSVPVPPPPEVGLKLDAEIQRCIRNLPEVRRCIRNLPEALRNDHMYRNRQFWYNFLAREHTARRRSTFHDD
jgi:hypothetical protein